MFQKSHYPVSSFLFVPEYWGIFVNTVFANVFCRIPSPMHSIIFLTYCSSRSESLSFSRKSASSLIFFLQAFLKFRNLPEKKNSKKVYVYYSQKFFCCHFSTPYNLQHFLTYPYLLTNMRHS